MTKIVPSRTLGSSEIWSDEVGLVGDYLGEVRRGSPSGKMPSQYRQRSRPRHEEVGLTTVAVLIDGDTVDSEITGEVSRRDL